MIKHYFHEVNGRNVIYRFSAANRNNEGRGSCFILRSHKDERIWREGVTSWANADGWIYVPRAEVRKLIKAAKKS